MIATVRPSVVWCFVEVSFSDAPMLAGLSFFELNPGPRDWRSTVGVTPMTFAALKAFSTGRSQRSYERGQSWIASTDTAFPEKDTYSLYIREHHRNGPSLAVCEAARTGRAFSTS